MSALDGSKLRRQRAWAWAEPPQVIIGNAGPLLDLAEKGALKCASVKLRVVDEVDAQAAPRAAVKIRVARERIAVNTSALPKRAE